MQTKVRLPDVEAAAEESPKRTVVEWRHNYIFETREIRPEHITQLFPELRDHKGLKLLRWSADNNWQIDKSELDFLSAEQYQSIIGNDPNFTVKDI